MLLLRIISVFVVFLGLADIVLAVIINFGISVDEPKSIFVFDGDIIKSTCTASDSHGAAVTITWHKQESSLPASTNSSNTTIISRNEGNTTISVFTTRDVKPLPPNYKVYRLYCKARNGNPADTKSGNTLLHYIKESDLPRLRVQIPQNQIVAKGTRRHQLTCQLFSNIDIKLKDNNVGSLSVRWSFGGKTLKNVEPIDLIKNTMVEYPILLQCLTKDDLGDYMCTVNVTMYKKIWYQSATTTLTADFPGNIGFRMMPAMVYHVMCFVLLILRNA